MLLNLHLAIEHRLVEAHAYLACHQLCEIARETIGVVKNEGGLAKESIGALTDELQA